MTVTGYDQKPAPEARAPSRLVRIPARRYTEQPGDIDPMTGEPTVVRVAEPLDANAVSVELWPFAG